MNTLTHLSVAGFRSLKQIEWKPGALNLLIGPNGSGKSNVLKAIEMLSCCGRGTLSKFVEREGGFSSISWDGGKAWSIGAALDFNDSRLGDSEHVAYRISLKGDSFSGDHNVETEAIGWNAVDSQPIKVASPSLLRIGKDVHVYLPGQQSEVVLDNEYKRESFFALFPSSLVIPLEFYTYRSVIGRWRIYRHLDTRPESPIRTSAIARREEQVDEDGHNVMQVLHTLYSENREFKSDVNAAMSAAFGDDFEELVFPPASDQRIQMRVRWKSLKKEQSAADLSDGTLRFLYLLAILGTPKPPPLIAIEEPEAGLHPSMLPIIAEFAQAAAEKTQVILTTHSSAMLDAFTDEPPQVTVTHWNEGQTELRTLAGEQLKYWLDQYTLGDLFRSGELETME